MHFFCELTKLPIESEAYGPVASNPDKLFNVGSKFISADVIKAFACVEGQMIVHQASSNADLVNVIIKPKSLDTAVHVKYFVYRGILKSSFFDGSNIVAKASDNTKFIAKLWAKWEADKQSNSNLQTLIPADIGYGLTTTTLKIEDIFNNTQTGFSSQVIAEGDWLGDFGTPDSIDFEIIVDTDHLDLTLDFLAKPEYIIDISSMPETTDEEKFSIRAKREEVLAFMDAAAFWGMYLLDGVSIKTYNGLEEKSGGSMKKQELYTTVLYKFLNKNRLYIDIRSERGYSYNFYDNYNDSNGKSLKLKTILL
jgi:hypothetical protein